MKGAANGFGEFPTVGFFGLIFLVAGANVMILASLIGDWSVAVRASLIGTSAAIFAVGFVLTWIALRQARAWERAFWENVREQYVKLEEEELE